MRYRPEVDGLRAIAVLPVVLFHAGYAAFQGGFVGVDVFFVISGYLITSIITEDIRQGRFSIAKFYERRIRRIFPALFVVFGVCTILACWVLLPAELELYARSLVAATLFVSNIYFWRDSGYFDPTSDTKPLLHTWSLGVEEQFYIFFPLALALIYYRLGRRWIPWVAAGAVASFALSLWMVPAQPTPAFYLLPTRAWELFLGALISLGAFPRVRQEIARQGLSLLGLGLIAWSAMTYSVVTPFPGLNALWPCLGAALIIYSSEGTLVGRLLSLGPVVFIGLISYSLYLWHWALLVLADLGTVSGLTQQGVVLVVVASFVLSVLNWRFVEQPFRGRSAALTRSSVFAFGGAAMAVTVAFGVFAMQTEGWPQRMRADVVKMASFAKRRLDQDFAAGLSYDTNRPMVFGADTPPSIAVWGDSHTMALALALGERAEASGRSLEHFWLYNCLPIVDLARRPAQTGCPEFVRQSLETIVANPALETVVLFGRWSFILEGEVDRPRRTGEFVDDLGSSLSDAEQRRLFSERFRDTIERFFAAGKRVALVYPTPEYTRYVPHTLARMLEQGRPPEDLTQPIEKHLKRHAFVIELFDSLPDSPALVRIRPTKSFCASGRCVTYANGTPLYKDADHLAIWGARMLMPQFDPIFEPWIDREGRYPETHSKAGADLVSGRH